MRQPKYGAPTPDNKKDIPVKDQKSNASPLKSALFGVAALGAISLISASPAYATPLFGNFGFTVWQGNNPTATGGKKGSGSDPSQIANSSNTILNGSVGGELAAFTYKGPLVFSEGKTGQNNILNFLESGGGTLKSFTSGNKTDLNTTMSSKTFNLTTVMDIHGQPRSTGYKGTVRSDDGSSIYTNNLTKKIAGNPRPHTAQSYAFTLPKSTAFDVLYVEANGLPAQLRVDPSPIPEPGSLGLLGIGLLGIGLFVRRRATRNAPALT